MCGRGARDRLRQERGQDYGGLRAPYQFEQFSCPQLAEEAQRLSHRASVVAGAQDEKATRDAVVTTVGIVVFWPALFFIGGNDQQTAELARLRGEMEAIEQVAIRKRCGIQFQRPAPPPAAPATSYQAAAG
jgi:hypothetical protein